MILKRVHSHLSALKVFSRGIKVLWENIDQETETQLTTYKIRSVSHCMHMQHKCLPQHNYNSRFGLWFYTASISAALCKKIKRFLCWSISVNVDQLQNIKICTAYACNVKQVSQYKQYNDSTWLYSVEHISKKYFLAP